LKDDLQGHIGVEELARLAEVARPKDAAFPLNVADVHPHLAVCMACRDQLNELVLLDQRLKRLRRPPQSSQPEPGCPEPEKWRQIAGGFGDPDRTLTYVEHASRCDYCGPLLHKAVAGMVDLNQSLSDAEKKFLATLDSSDPRWQRKLAQQITGATGSGQNNPEHRHWPAWFGVPQLVAGLSLLAIFVAAVWVATHQEQPGAADKLIAQAYTAKRTLELRIPGADYAPLRISRGPQSSFTNRPPALLKAEALIAVHLQSHPGDPAWLQAKAQADVLEGKYDAAVESLRRALELSPQSPALLTDLATAYFQRAQQEERKEDFGAAYEFLSEALKLRGDDPVALFNRAIVAEHQFLYLQALDDWQHYLRVDPSSAWAEEARNRANAVREVLKQHGSKADPLLSPARIADSAKNSGDVSIIDGRIEEYLHEAVRSWLPQSFPETGASSSDASKALFFLAQLAQRQHADRWLADLLAGSSSPHFSHAINALSRAIAANDSGSFDISRQQAEMAEHLFRSDGSAAGSLRAAFEGSFSAQMTRNIATCRARATAALAESDRHGYAWLQIQLGLENGVCSVMAGDIGADQKASAAAMELARLANYEALYLRALGFVIDDYFAAGDHELAAKLVSEGLHRFWLGHSPAMRGYNLYDYSAFAAQNDGKANLQLANWREGIGLIDEDEDLLLRAEAHGLMAEAAVTAVKPAIAREQYAEATRLYALAPQTEATRTHRLEAEIKTAQFEARQNLLEPALSRLLRIQSQIKQLSNNFIAQLFYSTLGEVQLRSHHYGEAEQAFRPALALAEQNLSSIRSEAERSNWIKNASSVYLGLAEAELVQGRERAALETYEWYLGADQRLRNPAPVESRLPLMAKETVIAYAVLPDGLAIWIYDNRGIHASWSEESTEGLRELARRFGNLTSDPTSESSALERDGRALYRALVAPLEAQLDPRRALVIEADGWLATVPFEALIDANHHYLIERAAVIHSLGGDSEASSRNDNDRGIFSDSRALVVASTASSGIDGLIPLPDVAGEADIVGGDFHGAKVLKGAAATLGAVRSGLPKATLFHFAGHSLSTPERTGLMLYGDDSQTNLFDAATVRALNLKNLQLAVLSACSTAAGGGGSSGFNSVTDSFLREGVPHVIASRWAVDSVSAQAFVEDFYRGALSGEPVSEALRQTERKILADQRTSHPYYWSAFAAYGRP
jgi:CHAT domain-containing protein/tetratricopeptide (TPR) repeat protein